MLTSHWHDAGNRHFITLYGRSPQLGPVEVVFDQSKPVFFVSREEKLPALDFSFDRKNVNLHDFSGRPVDALYFNTQKEQRYAADRFRATGVRHFEADVRPEARFLMERFIHGGAKLMGTVETDGNLSRMVNPKIKAAQVPLNPVVLSVDIETGVESGRLYSIGCDLWGPCEPQRTVFMLAGERRDVSPQLKYFPSERELLRAFLQWFDAHDPDIIIGWHVIGFDLMYLERKCADLGLTLDLCRGEGKVVLTEKPGAGFFADIRGRVVIDGPPLLRAAGISFANYKLETVANTMLGTSKLITADGAAKIAEIERQFREDKEQLAQYNLEDCILVSQIFQKAQLIELQTERVVLCGVPFDSLGIPHATLDRFFLPRLHRKGLVAPCSTDVAGEGAAKPKAILEPRPGVYDGVCTLDFNSFYTNLIQTFHIDPYARVRAENEPLTTPSGQRFSAREHLLPGHFSQLLQQRQQKPGYGERAVNMVLKHFISGLTTASCRFFHEDLAGALDGCGAWLLREAAAYLAKSGCRALFGDASSLVIKMNENARGPSHAKNLAKDLGQFCQRQMQAEFGVNSAIDFEFGRFFTRFVLPPAKLQSGQTRKRYAGWGPAESGDPLDLEGMAFTGSNWTRLAQSFQPALFKAFFQGEDIEVWLRDFAAQLRAGKFDQQLTYTKKLKKDLAEYSKNVPPQVKAARMLKNPGRQIKYVFTKHGPAPVELKPSDFDYDHYLEKQIQPVADLLLLPLEKSYRAVIDQKQFELF